MTRAAASREIFHFGRRKLSLPIPGERILLRLPAPGDRSALVALLNERSVSRGTLRIPFPYRAADAVDYIRRARKRFREGTDLPMVIERRSDGQLIGGLGIHQISPEAQSATLGYWIGLPYRRKGFASEAVAVGVEACFGPLALHRIEACVFLFNDASKAVLRRAGFRREGVAREVHWKDGRWFSEIRYSRLATDPGPRGTRAEGRRRRPKG